MSDAKPDPSQEPTVYREPVLSDGASIHALVRQLGSLDLNSAYCYLLLATHFAGTCAVATRSARLVGFVSGYLEPIDPSVLFIWQVAVHPETRGQGVAKRLLAHVLDRPGCVGVRFIEATVTPSNAASAALFQRVALDRGGCFNRRPGFRTDDFGRDDHGHEPEELVRIGPFDKQRSVT